MQIRWALKISNSLKGKFGNLLGLQEGPLKSVFFSAFITLLTMMFLHYSLNCNILNQNIHIKLSAFSVKFLIQY